MDTKPKLTSGEFEAYARREAQTILASFQAEPEEVVAHRQRLQDAKLALCREVARAVGANADAPLVWNLASDLPDFDTEGLYQTRASFLSLAVAVFLGWLLGGVLATLLGFLGLGGEIWRPGAILGALWLEQYLGSNPKARRILLTVLGLGALGRFAMALAGGAVRLSGMGGIRQLIFGSGPRPNIFKTAWLWFGAFFLYVLFAKKISGLDITGFEDNLTRQMEQRMQLVSRVLDEVQALKTANLAQGERSKSDAYCPRKHCILAQAAISLLDSLDADKRKYLANVLGQAGYEVNNLEDNTLIWDAGEYGQLYEPVGLVRDGDRCLILSRPYQEGDSAVKGKVQRL